MWSYAPPDDPRHPTPGRFPPITRERTSSEIAFCDSEEAASASSILVSMPMIMPIVRSVASSGSGLVSPTRNAEGPFHATSSSSSGVGAVQHNRTHTLLTIASGLESDSNKATCAHVAEK